MNWLGHVLLAEPTPEARLGHLLADVLKAPERATLAPAVRAAVAEHVAVDRFTDTHAATRRSVAAIGAPYRRFAGVLADVFHGHVLARDWHQWSDRPLGEFTADVYASIRGYDGPLPARARTFVAGFTADDGLGAYATLEGVRWMLHRIASRLAARFQRTVELEGAVALLEADAGHFEADFSEVFPALRAAVHGWRNSR